MSAGGPISCKRHCKSHANRDGTGIAGQKSIGGAPAPPITGRDGTGIAGQTTPHQMAGASHAPPDHGGQPWRAMAIANRADHGSLYMDFTTAVLRPWGAIHKGQGARVGCLLVGAWEGGATLFVPHTVWG